MGSRTSGIERDPSPDAFLATTSGSLLKPDDSGVILASQGPQPAVRVATIVELLMERANEAPDQVALEGASGSLTFEDLRDGALRFASTLIEAGVAPGDRVAIHCINRYAAEFGVAIAGTLAAGAIAVPVNVRLSPLEIGRICDNAEPTVVVTGSPGQAGFEAWASRSGRRLVVVDARELPVLVLRSKKASPFLGDPLDDAFIIYTSGTTGIPKGATFDHRGMCWMADRMAQVVIGPSVGIDPLASGEAIQCALPIYTSSGILHVLLPVLYSGAVARIEDSFDAERSLRLATDAGSEVYFGVPTMLTLMADVLDESAFSGFRLRCCFFGGAPCPVQTIKRLERHWPDVTLVNVYSLTESAAAMSVHYGEALRHFPDASGIPGVPAELRVTDDQGVTQPVEESGIVEFRGPGMMLRYFRDEERTAETLRDDGWLVTGDIGRIASNGLLWLHGRKHDLLIRGGFNIYPAEIETVLEQHPAVMEVGVVGKPHRVLGDDLVAFVVLRPGASAEGEELREFCRGKLADYKIPRDVRFDAEQLPRNAHDKLVRESLRARL